MATGGGDITSTKNVLDASPSGVLTMTGTDDLGAGALPLLVSVVVDTNVVASIAPSNEMSDPAVKPTPLTVTVKVPAGIGDGVTDVMPGSGITATDALPLDEGDAVLVARIVTRFGFGTSVGAMY